MDAINVMVKDVANFFDNLDGYDRLIIAEFYDERGYYIGQIEHDDVDGSLTISKELRTLWKNKVKFYRMYTLQDTVMFTFVVMKGEER